MNFPEKVNVKAYLGTLLNDLGEGSRRWLSLLLVFAGLAGVFAFLAVITHNGFDWSFRNSVTLGHITRAYGTVKLEQVGRLEASKNLLVPFHLGELIQTGEDSAAEALFFGGSLLELQSGSVAKFEDAEESVAIRILMGKAYFEFPPESVSGMHFVFQKADGKLVELPSSRRVVVTLNSAANFDDAVEVETLDPNEKLQSLDEAELKYMALGDKEFSNDHPLLVRPINDHPERRPAAMTISSQMAFSRGRPSPTFPPNEAEVDIEAQEKIAFSWKPAANSSADPIIGYEVVVRPAFSYDTEDRARMVQVIRGHDTSVPIDKVGGGGVFLWSVRAVTASGSRGPASTPRWLEIKFPKQLAAPEFMKPKVE